MIKLIASDMDGTLLNSKHVISKGNVEAIKKAQELGVDFAIVTGRDYNGVKDFAKEFDLNCEFILMNGAEYRDRQGNILEGITLNKNTLEDIIKIMDEAGLIMEIFTGDSILVKSKEEAIKLLEDRFSVFDSDAADEEVKAAVRKFMNRRKIESYDSLDDLMDESLNIYKIITFNKDEKLIQETKNKLRQIEGLSVVSTFSNDIEICDIQAQKGLILAKVAKKMGLEKDEVMVLGDSFNDYSMFTEFKNSYAMKNAIPEIKEIAGFITDTNDNDGVAKAIYSALNI